LSCRGSSSVYGVLECLYERFSPGTWLWLVSYSGGKDSSLLLLSAIRFAESRGFTIAVVYNDCGGDLPELRGLVYRVLDVVRARGHTVYVTRPERTFFDYLLSRYSPPRWNFRWCCKRIKELPFRRLAEELSEERPVLNLLGLRREEARWRNWVVKAVNSKLVYAAPLNRLTTGEVWQLLWEECSRDRELGFLCGELSKIYNGAERSGCWFCPLVAHDKLLESRPELLKLKLEVLEAWCTGRRERIVELSRQHPDLIELTAPVDTGALKPLYPCGRKCGICDIRIRRIILRDALKRKAKQLDQPPTLHAAQ